MPSHWSLNGLSIEDYIEHHFGYVHHQSLKECLCGWLAMPLPPQWSFEVTKEKFLVFFHKITGLRSRVHPQHSAMLHLCDVYHSLYTSVMDAGRRADYIQRRSIKHQEKAAACENVLWQGPFTFDYRAHAESRGQAVDPDAPRIPGEWWVHAETGQMIHEDPAIIIDEMVVLLRRYTKMMCLSKVKTKTLI